MKQFWSRNYFVYITIIIVLTIITSSYAMFMQNRLALRTQVFQENIAFASEGDVLKSIERQINNYLQGNIEFINGEYTKSIPLSELGIEFSREEVQKKMFHQVNSSFIEKSINVLDIKDVVTINHETLYKNLQKHFPKLLEAPINASIEFIGDQYVTIDAKLGYKANTSEIIQALKKNIHMLAYNPISIQIDIQMPDISTESGLQARNHAEYLSKQTITLFDPIIEKKWNIPISDHYDWIIFTNKEDYIDVTLSPEKINSYLELNLATEIEKDVQNINLRYDDQNNISIEGIGQDGYDINIDASTNTLIKNSREGIFENDLITAIVPAQVIQNGTNIGIKELIAEGSSDFSGSPANRIHNIERGRQDIHNIILQPGEEFSTLAALGTIDASTGYKAELVIKGNDLEKEWGGGLCQVSSTLYRSVLYGGLEITEWDNHSRLVSYYEPIGLDATIYDPHKDFRFRNDTQNPILIQNFIDLGSNILTFRIWGINDGRTVDITTSGPYEWTGIPEDIYEDVDWLKPGETKRKSKGQRGVTADWTRVITYSDGRDNSKELFQAKYRAIPAVYERGIDPDLIIEEANFNNTDNNEDFNSQ